MPTLEWIGKSAVVEHHNEVPFHLLECDEALSVGDPGSGNLLIQADNLLALKALLPYYAGKVKCIYIDPPYNTGNESWVYNDNVNSPEVRAWLGQVVGREAEDLSRHDKWLCMMYPRLVLLHDLLAEDGVIFISIDDNELANLQVLIDEIFGANNVLATLVWQKGKKGDSKFFSVMHEYVSVTAKNKSVLVAKNTKWRRRKEGIDDVLLHYEHLRNRFESDHERIRTEMLAWFRSLPRNHPAKKHKHYNWSDDKGLYFAADFAGPDDGRENRPRYDIPHPISGKPCKKPSTGWRWEEERTLLALTENPPRIHFGPDETTIPCRKSYLFEIDREPFPSVFYKDGRAATLEVESILGPGAFSFPKDTEIIADLIDLVCNKEDIILDSFAGSGTTGAAIMKLNKSDQGQRRFILVELEPEICQSVTRLRLERVASGYAPLGRRTNVDFVPGLGGGFRFCRLGLTLFDATGQIRDEVTYAALARHVYFTETGEPQPQPGDSPLLGIHQGVAIYLLFNGVMGDHRPQGGNILTAEVLASLPPHGGPKVIYGEGCLLSPASLQAQGISFRQVPYEVKVR